MLNVLTPEEAFARIEGAFAPRMPPETAPLREALGRVLVEPVLAEEYVPGFDRSTVDGYAVQGADTFGCSDAIPAILQLAGEVAMGVQAAVALAPGTCVAVPTGGAVPPGADAVVMQEYAEDYGDGTIGILKPAAPGANLILRGDDVSPGKPVLPAGRALAPQDIGALSALGRHSVQVCKRPVMGIISTGDELVPVEARPGPGQVRDVNAAMLGAVVQRAGGEALHFGIVRDDRSALKEALALALDRCDGVLLSGGSSVGKKDVAALALEDLGEVLFHGLAMKPGKPTLLGRVAGKPALGLPGHPAAAFFVASLFVPLLLARLTGRPLRRYTVPARLTEALSANHGRAQYVGVGLSREGDALLARPIYGKSGLITTLAGADGYFCIPRDCEGFPAGTMVEVALCGME